MIAVRLRHLPADSATLIALGGAGWTLQDYLLAHVFQAFAGIPHPSLPSLNKSEDPIRVQRLKEFKKRAQERREKLATGEIPN